MLLLGYILVTCHNNNIVTLHVTFMLYRRNKTCLLGSYSSIQFNSLQKDASIKIHEMTEILKLAI